MFDNFIPGPSALGVSSARPGMVGSPAAEALGSATCLAAGAHTGALDQVLVVEIDSLAAGDEVGLATFRWKRESAGAWEASGVPTSVNLTPLADGVSVKWVPGPGQEFYKGDRWSILATGCQGPQALMDRDRDTAWRSLDCAAQFIEADLGQAQEVRALVLADHNLTSGATATLKGTDTPEPSAPIWRFDPAGGSLVNDSGVVGANSRATGRTYIDGGVLKYAAAGESGFEDGQLSIEPAATNLLLQSGALDNAPWSTWNATVVADQTKSPDGNITADIIKENGADSTHQLIQTVSLDDDTDYIISIFAKAKERYIFALGLHDKADAYKQAYFNLSTGATGSKTAAASWIESLGAGWYRCSVRVDSSSGVASSGVRLYLATSDPGNGNYPGYQGDGTSGLYAWGAQLEAGTVPTAYIPTTTSTGYRAKDNILWDLPQDLKNILSVEQLAPTAVLDQTAGGIVLSTVAGTAFAMPNDGSGADLIPYAYGQHILKIVDSAGKVAWAGIGAAGTGETLGAELITNGTFDSDISGWTTDTGTVGTISCEAGAMKMEQGSLSEYLRASQDVAVTQGALVKAGATSDGAAYQSFSLGILGNSTAFYGSGFVAGTTWEVYFNKSTSDDVVFKMQHAASAYSIANWDNATLKQVLTPSEQGVWLESTPGASDKTWTYIQSGFNPNSIASWAVYPASDWLAKGTLVVKGVVFGFSAGDIPGSQIPIISCAESIYSLLRADSGSTLVRTSDGTNAPTVSLEWQANIPYDFVALWSSDNRNLKVCSKLSGAAGYTDGAEAAFDGAFTLGGYLRLGYNAIYPFKMGILELYDYQLEAPLEKSLDPWEHPDHSQTLTITRPHLVCFLDQTCRYWRLELDDPANPEGLLRASLFYLGGSFEPRRTFRAGYGQGSVATRKVMVGSGGKVAGSSGAVAAYYQLEFARLDDADAQGLEEMLAAVHAGGEGGLRPLFFTPFTDDPGRTLYCLPGAELARQEAPGGRWNLSLRLEEVVKSDV